MTAVELSTNLVEQLARINQMQADILEKEARTRWLPWQVMASAAVAMAGLVGAGAALAALILK